MFALNELQTLISKAAVGAGLPSGHAHDLSAAGIWLAQRGFPVCSIVARALASGQPLPPKERLARRADSLSWTAGQAAWEGPGAIDLLMCLAPEISLELTDWDEPLLMLGLVGAATDMHQLPIELSSTGTCFAIGPGGSVDREAVASIFASSLRLRRSRDAAWPTIAELPQRYDPTATSDLGWPTLEALAGRTYVPSSSSSRTGGAGAGLTDND